MNSTRKESQTWQKMLAQAREMRGQAGAALYDRMQLLVNVFEDADWRIRNGNFSEDEWMGLLDEEVSDVFLSFGELRDMLIYAPERSQWSDGRLDKLRAEMIESRKRGRQAAKDNGESTGGATRKSLKEKYTELETENQRLVRELAKAEGRIEELERIVNGELAVAAA